MSKGFVGWWVIFTLILCFIFGIFLGNKVFEPMNAICAFVFSTVIGAGLGCVNEDDGNDDDESGEQEEKSDNEYIPMF